jgi:hypothetical protein
MKPQWIEEQSGIVTSEQSCPTILAESASAELGLGAVSGRGRWGVGLLWLGAACAIVGMAIFLDFGCDAKDYLAVLHGSPGLAYSPLFMIPTVGLAKLLPLWLTMALFGLAYFSGWLTQLWVGMQCATPDERRILCYVAPVIAFFPGLLISDVIVSGNLAYVLYGMMLAGAAWGWKRGRWNWFYLAVLAAACVKVHLLTMLAIPLLCGRRQWMRAVVTGATGLSLYALQSRIWPQAFHVYLNSLKQMSQSRRDFGCGPVGNLARILQRLGVPHEMPCILFYAIYAVVLFLLLLGLSRLYRERRICFESWAPVMLMGVVLLNPRIQSYDVAAVSLPMALVAWRSLRDDGKIRRPVLIGAAIVLLGLNVFLEVNEDFVTMLPDAWKYLEMLMMLGIFAGGVRGLLKEAGVEWPARSESYIAGSFVPESERPVFDSAD